MNRTWNFSGSTDSYRIAGSCPTGRGWEYSGGTWSSISAASATPPACITSAVPPTVQKHRDGVRKNDTYTKSAVALQQLQQGAPMLLALHVVRTTGLTFYNQCRNKVQQGMPPQQPSQITIYTKGRDRSNPGDVDADDCETQAQDEWQRRLVEGPAQRRWQRNQHVLRLPVGNCRAAKDGIGPMLDDILPERLESVASTAALEASGRSVRVLLHSVAGTLLQTDSGGHHARQARHASAERSSFVCDPARDGCVDSSLGSVRGQLPAGGLAARCLVGAVAGAGGRLREKATGGVGARICKGCPDCASFDNFFESPYPEGSSDRSTRNRECSACSSLSSGSGGRLAALSKVAVESAARAFAEESGEPQGETNRMLPQREHQTNEESEHGTQSHSQEEQQRDDLRRQEKVLPRSTQRLEQALPKERKGQNTVSSREARHSTITEIRSGLSSRPPELLTHTHLASQVRVLRQDPTTGATQERLVQVLLIHRSPEIFYIPELLTDAECDHLIEICRGRWERSKTSTGYATADPHEYSSMNSANRTSSSVPLGVGETMGVENVERLAAAFADMNLENLEPLVIVRYQPGECFKAHHDGGFRPKTLLLYLNDVEEGGETSFENLGFCITPAKRAGVLWANAYPGTNMIDPRMLHAGRPPNKGVKYVVNCFFNKYPVRLDAWRTGTVPPVVPPRV